MSKTKIGDKYIIEIDRCYSGELYGVKRFRSLVFDQNGLDKLTPYDADEAYADGYTFAESKYREAHDEIEQEAYQRGLDVAWDAVKKIVLSTDDGGYSYNELNECFGETRESVSGIIKNTPLTEIIKTIREYEERKAQDTEIKVGDEVCRIDGDKRPTVVTRVDVHGVEGVVTKGELKGMAIVLRNLNNLEKTGRHVDLSELFWG